MQLAKAMPSIQSIVRVQFYSTSTAPRVEDPYDCSHQHSSGGGNSTKYCLQSRFYSCAANVHCPIPEIGGECTAEGQAKVAAFLPCAEASGPSGLSTFENALPCAKKHGLDVAAIQKCFDTTDISYTGPAVKTIDAIGNATDAATDPVVQFYPDVRVAGKLQTGTVEAAGLIKAVCAAYTGSQKPPACNSASVEQA